MWLTMIQVGSQFGGLALLNLKKIDQNHMGFWCTIISVWKFSPPISHVIQHPAVVPHIWLLSHSTNISILWHLHPKPHVFKIFDPSEDYESFQRHIILLIIHEPHDYQSIHYTKKPTLPPLIVFAPDWCSIKLVYKLIFDINVNLTNITPFVHYISYPPHQSSIPNAWHLTSHGYLSSNIPGCFILNNKEAFLKGGMVVLELDIYQKVVMEEIIEVGRHFILYVVKEVGSIPMGGVWITQLVAPLNSHLSVFFHFLLLILMAFFPCFFWSSAIFEKIDRVSGRDEVQSWFSDSFPMVYISLKDILHITLAGSSSPFLISSCCFLSSHLVFMLDS